MTAKNPIITDSIGNILFDRPKSCNLLRQTNKRLRKHSDWSLIRLTSGTNPLYAFHYPAIQAVLK